MKTFRRWTEKEIDFLHQNYGTHSNISLGDVLNRTAIAVQHKANNLGLRKVEIKIEKKYCAPKKIELREIKELIEPENIKKRKVYYTLPNDIQEILNIVCKYYSIPEELIQGYWRLHEIAIARHFFFYLLKIYCNYTSTRLAILFERDHSSILNNFYSASDLIDSDEVLRRQFKELKKLIESNALFQEPQEEMLKIGA